MGMKDYFEQCLGRILLYRFERQQFYEVRAAMDRGAEGFEGRKGVGDVYGAEHLCRLFGTCVFIQLWVWCAGPAWSLDLPFPSCYPIRETMEE